MDLDNSFSGSRSVVVHAGIEVGEAEMCIRDSFMGRRFNEVSEEIKMVPYKVVQSGDHVAVLAQGLSLIHI